MNTLTRRPYRQSADLETIAHLFNTSSARDRLERRTSGDRVAQDFRSPDFDVTRDVALWENAGGEAISYATVWAADEYFEFVVHPDYRDGAIEADILAWVERRMRELHQKTGKPVRLQTSAYTTETQRLAVLEVHGFTPERRFFRMKRSLGSPIPELQFPAGFTCRPIAGKTDGKAWVEMFNQSFVDHWNHHDLTVERFEHELDNPNYIPELNLIAIAPCGTFAGFCCGAIFPEDNRHKTEREGWINSLGTRRGFRRRGVGRALLLETLRRLREAGTDVALLGVDAENPSGAFRLYQSVGFSPILTMRIESKCLKS